MGSDSRQRTGRLLGPVLALLLGAGAFAPAAWASGKGCLLLEASRVEDAELKVYFTKFPKEDTSSGKYRGCRKVKKAEAGATTFFVTPFRQDATVVVHPSNWPE